MTEYLYPAAGDLAPLPGARVQILTVGGVHVSGPWSNDGFCLGWSELPDRNQEKEDLIGNKKC